MMFYYKQIRNGNIVSVEAKSIDVASPHFVKATKVQYDEYIALLPPSPPLKPPRDPLAEIDDLSR